MILEDINLTNLKATIQYLKENSKFKKLYCFIKSIYLGISILI